MAGSKNTQITVAVISLVGVLGTAIFTNWDKIFPPDEGSKETINNQGETTKPETQADNPPVQTNERVYIQKVNTKSPDYIVLANRSNAEIMIGGYQIREDTNTFDIPHGTTIPGNGTLRIYFFSRKKPENRVKAAALKKQGNIVCAEFGLSAGETVELIDAKGKFLSRK